MATTAKFPNAALADFGADTPNIVTAVLSGVHNASVTTITLTATVPASWPTAGWVTIDGEIISYTGKSGATLTGCTRGTQTTYGGGIAASHADQAIVGPYLTAQQVNQIVAEIIAMQGSVSNPNLVLNSDFGRRTVFGLAMPEVFADLSGTTKIDGGAAGSVAANVFTQGAANNEYAWCAGSFVWRDGRASATFKAVATAGIYELRWRISATDYISVKQNNGNFTITKFIASSLTVVSTVANALTLNRWYWIELDKQGTTINARFYDTGGTVPGVTKASSTETTAARLTGTVADASVAVGAAISITSDQATAQWGGIATGNGGVYVETWLPESWAITHTGTLGGQAVGYDEAADSGPINKQSTPVVYIPAVSRTMTVQYSGPDGGMQASTAYDFSYYLKNTSLGGSGVMIRGNVLEQNSASATQATNSQDDAAETSYTRKSATFTTNAATRRFAFQFLINQGGARTGTVRFSLPQVELGSAATAWRNAPADDASIVWDLGGAFQGTTSSATAVEADSRSLAGNLFVPWDARLRVEVMGPVTNTGANNAVKLGATVDAATLGSVCLAHQSVPVANNFITLSGAATTTAAAGKHRVAMTFFTSAGTMTLTQGPDPRIIVTATRGK